MKIEIENLHFKDIKEFYLWNCMYHKCLYVIEMDFVHKKEKSRIRKPNVKGSVKLGKMCPSRMYAKIVSTHKTNYYDYILITIMVTDEYHKDYPIAFCITSSADEAVYGYLQKYKT
jgi:hypothetical protein